MISEASHKEASSAGCRTLGGLVLSFHTQRATASSLMEAGDRGGTPSARSGPCCSGSPKHWGHVIGARQGFPTEYHPPLLCKDAIHEALMESGRGLQFGVKLTRA